MVGFGKIMHLEVTKMTDGSTIKLVEACWRITMSVIIWKSKRTTENVRFNFQYLMFQYLI